MKSLETLMNNNKKRGKILKVEENLFCEGCKNRYDYYEIEKSDGTIQEIKSGCDCEAKQMAEQKVKEYKAKIKRSEIDRMFNKSKVNDDLQSATFDKYIPRNESQQKAKDTMQRYAQNFNLDNKQSIMLRSSFGLGKSALAMATIKEIKEKGYTVLFYDITELIALFRDTMSKSAKYTETELINRIKACDVLVIDDLSPNLTDFEKGKLFSVINARVNKHNIITTNNTNKELTADKMLTKIYSRMMMNTTVIEVEGTDYRLTKK